MKIAAAVERQRFRIRTPWANKRLRVWPVSWPLSRKFLLANLAISVAGAVIIGAIVARQIEEGVLSRTAAITALYVDSVLTPHLQVIATRGSLDESDIATLDSLVADSALGQRIVAFKVWSPEGQILYSPNRQLVGQRFPEDKDLSKALQGEVTADISNVDEPENEYERLRWNRLVQVYTPVRQDTTGRIIASTEFYQLPDELEADIRSAQLRSWAVVGGTMAIAYLLLGGMVGRASRTISVQQTALEQQVEELSHLLQQNAELQTRVHAAAERTTTLNEQSLRRTSADLHDGPAQALALALLRLGELKARAENAVDAEDFEVVHTAVRDAMTDIRAISAGLRLPSLEGLSVLDIVSRAVADHERRSDTKVQLEWGQVPAEASHAVKIALLRTLQEALSNATRHGQGLGVSVRLGTEAGALRLVVSDDGPGLNSSHALENGGLGLANMRERAELLGGSFQIDSSPGGGVAVTVSWPLS